MRWLADECVSSLIVARLRDSGHDVLFISEIDPGVSDSEVVARADLERRLLLTEDKDFGELVFRWHRSVPGIVLLRISPDTRECTWQRLEDTLQRYGEGLVGRYTVVEDERIRSRSLI